MKYAVFETEYPQLMDVRLKLGRHRSFFSGCQPIHLISLCDEKTGDTVVLQTKKTFLRGPMRNLESGELKFSLDQSSDSDFYSTVTRLEADLETKVIDFLANDELASELPLPYRAIAREAKKSRQKMREIYASPSEASLGERYEEYMVNDSRSHVLKRCFTNGKIWLKLASDFRAFDETGELIGGGDKALKQGGYEFGVRLGDVYIGPHGDSGYIASLQCRIVQLRYDMKCTQGTTPKSTMNICILHGRNLPSTDSAVNVGFEEKYSPEKESVEKKKRKLTRENSEFK